MDPFARPTIPWTGPIPTNEEDVYYLANNLGYNFPGMPSVGSLSGQEIDDIARFPPVWEWQDYKIIRTLDRDQLAQKAPGILEILPNISRDDLFYFITRRRLPNYEDLQEVINRLDIYDNLSYTTHLLLNKIYGDRMSFATTFKISALEDYIIAYDLNLGLTKNLFFLAIRMGVKIPIDHDPDIYLYDWFNSIIDYTKMLEAESIEPTINNNTLPKLEDFLDIDKESFNRFMKKFHLTTPEILDKYGQEAYDNRLDILLNLYKISYPDLNRS